jgi:16S rRNA (uracil1498-N3)-methyltransferase
MLAHHASHVLRLRDGAPVVLFNGHGVEYRGFLTQRGARVALQTHQPLERESPIRIVLVQAWIATDKLEWVVEKCVELGVAGFVLFPARRSVVQLDPVRRARRLERLRDTIVAACCQCGRNRIPEIELHQSFDAALAAVEGEGLRLILVPDPEAGPLATDAGRGIAVAIGPEGGFTDVELRCADRTGFRRVRLGPRVLRTETAGPAALAALQVLGGDLAEGSLTAQAAAEKKPADAPAAVPPL